MILYLKRDSIEIERAVGMEKQRKIRLKGHESFMVRDGWLRKGIVAVKNNPNVFSEYMGADALGVGSNMAKAIRYWLKVLGLTREVTRKGTYLTELGSLIFEQDGYFEDIFTIWLLHLQLLFHKEDATTWYLFFNEVGAEEFSREELYYLLRQAMNFYSGEGTYSERSLESDGMVLLNMYVRQREIDYDPEEKLISPFSALGLLRAERKRYRKQQPELDRLPPQIVWISILMMYQDMVVLDIHFIKKQERFGISIDDLLQKKNGPGKVLNLNRTALNLYLDKLYAGGYLEVNRTAGLDMVYLKPEYLDILEIAQDYYKNCRDKETGI